MFRVSQRAVIATILVLSGSLGACDTSRGEPLAPLRPAAALGPLRVSDRNPRYFADPEGNIVYLTGRHTWTNLQDVGGTQPPPEFDYERFLDQHLEWNHNFFRLWSWEQGSGSADTREEVYFAPLPYLRTGPGTALDGGPRYDLTKFDPAYFDRLRERVRLAENKGIYVAVMLFNGWSIEDKDRNSGNPWPGHPFNGSNNINGVDGDLDHDGEGIEVHTLANPDVLRLQEDYVRKVIDSVNEFSNVLYEISNESPNTSYEWQLHMIDVIAEYQRSKPNQHPIGMTVTWPAGSNEELYASPATWISPNGGLDDPPVADGRKVILDDTDHLCGICGDEVWVWKSFLRGRNPIFMDLDDGRFPLDPPFDVDDSRWDRVRRNLGYTLSFANRVNLAELEPLPALASSGFCLAAPGGSEPEYLVLIPEGREVLVDLSDTQGELSLEWFFPRSGRVVSDSTVEGGSLRKLEAPMRGPAVAYLRRP